MAVFMIYIYLNLILSFFTTNSQEDNPNNNQLIIDKTTLSSIIILGDIKYRYIEMTITSKEDLLIETYAYPLTKKRVFLGFKSNGRYYFENEETLRKEIIVDDNSTEGKIESSSLLININKKEYWISISKENCLTELYDTEKNDIIFFNTTQNFLGIYVYSYQSAFFKFSSFNNDENNYYFYGTIIKNEDTTFSIFLAKYYFSLSDSLLTAHQIKNYTINSLERRTMSCFQSNNKMIACYISDTDNKYKIIVLDENLQIKKKTEIASNENFLGLYYYCIYFKENIGIFMHYICASDHEPKIIIKKINEDGSVSDYLSSSSKIIVKYSNYNTNLYLNDLIKLTDSKFCHVGVSTGKDNIYISIFTIDQFNNVINVNTKNYTIDSYNLYNYKIYKDIKLQLFNNFIVFGSSFCNSNSCGNKDDNYYSSIMIFSYPNSTDIYFDVIDSLCTKSYSIINDIVFNLTENINIENNIFGYTLSKIKITNIPNTNDINILSKNSNKYVQINDTLPVTNSIIQIIFSGNYYDSEYYYVEFVPIAIEKISIENNQPGLPNIGGQPNQPTPQQNNEFEYLGRTGKIYIHFKILSDIDNTTNNCEIILIKINYYSFYHKKDNSKVITVNIPYEENIEEKINEEEEKIEEEVEENEEKQEKQEIKEIEEKEEVEDFEESEEAIKEKEKEKIEEEIKEKNESKKEKKENKEEIEEKIEEIELLEKEEKFDEYEKSNNNSNKDEDTVCTKDQIKNNNCHSVITDDQTKEVYNDLKNDLIKGNYTENKENIIILTENVVFQLSTLEDQKNPDSTNSIVDLGNCEEILKKQYDIPEEEDLIILKTETMENEVGSRYVQYEIYDPFSLEKLDLTYCEDVKIEVSIPVKLDNLTQALYEELSAQGYNLFDSNDDFYNDICTPYTSENGTDLTISLRQNTLYKSLCQDNCEFNSFNSSNNRANCNCEAQKNETKTDVSEIKFVSNLFFNSFYSVIKVSNFFVMKCYKLAFKIDFNAINIGRITMTVLLILFIILICVCCKQNEKKLLSLINIVIKIRFDDNKLNNLNINNLQSRKGETYKNNKNFGKNSKIKIKKVNNFGSKKKLKTWNIKKNKESKISNESTKKNLVKVKEPPKKDESKKRKSLNRRQYISPMSIHSISKEKCSSNELSSKKLSKTKVKNNQKKIKNNINAFSYIKKNDKTIKYKNKIKNIQNKSIKIINTKKNLLNNRRMLNNYELNSLEYKEAIILDKRTYCQYYFNCLKQRQLIFFSFCPENDYNLGLMKILMFILSFSLYFTITAFFFTDETMNKISVDNGKYNFISQLPQMIYSSLISMVINTIIKNLSLSEKNILLIKKEKNIKLALKKSKEISHELKIKFFIFYILGGILMIFYWYFISCFCAVYRNTQIILIKNTIYSFLLSMSYYFGIELLPGIFRIPALKAKKKDKKCMFKFGNFLALF